MLWIHRSVVLAVLVATVSGCGGVDKAADAHHRIGQGADGSLSHSAGETELDVLYTEITGTALQRGAGEEVAFHREQDPRVPCIAAHGVDSYTAPTFVNLWATWPA